MPTKIKRCLYVGLGGTGMNAILHTKKAFIEEFGEVPPMIGFLGIDTDNNAYTKSLRTIKGNPVVLEQNEQIPITVRNPKPIYDNNKEKFTWLPQRNEYALTSLQNGAGQVRTNGRFAFTCNNDTIKNVIGNSIIRITNAQIQANANYALLNNNIEIHMVFSIGGGTGSGTFLNMAYLLQEVAGANCKLAGYAVLPDVFKSMGITPAGIARIYPNSYGAISDLDYLMNVGLNDEIPLQYINQTYTIRTRPFNSIVFIDNTNANQDTYTHIDELTEMISLALVTASGDLSTANASTMDNIENYLTSGTMDIKNKRAWVAGMGACEIIYRKDILSEIYATKAAIELFNMMLTRSIDANVKGNNWIDSPEVHIRENNKNDHTIDFIADKNPPYSLTIDNCNNVKSEIDTYLNANLSDEAVDKNTTVLIKRVDKALDALLDAQINQKGGVNDSLSIMNVIDGQIDLFLGEMKEEKEKLENSKAGLKTVLETEISDLTRLNDSFFKLQKNLESHKQTTIEAAQEYCINLREIKRRDAAITVFNHIKNTLSTKIATIKNLNQKINVCIDQLNGKLARLENGVGNNSHMFEIDLTQKKVTTMSVNTEEILFTDFIGTLSLDHNLLNYERFSQDRLIEETLKYTKSLNTVQEIERTTIDDVINSMEKEELGRTLNLAVSRSLPLLQYDHRGYQPQVSPADIYYVGVHDKRNSRLFRDNYLKNLIPGNPSVDFSDIASTDKIILYRQIAVVPAFAISNIERYRRDANTNIDPHFDYNLERKMESENFSIDPQRNDDNMLDFWVKGFIFGLIKNENGTYYVKSYKNGEALDDYWMKLDKYRDIAYQNFQQYKESIQSEFTDHINRLASDKGNDEMNSILANAKENYFENFSQINMTRKEIKRRGNERICQLIKDELNHVRQITREA